jgi:hypothetical protein
MALSTQVNQYVRYWADGNTAYCWLQVNGNEVELKKLETLLIESKSVTAMEWSQYARQFEVDVVMKWAKDMYQVAQGTFTCPPNCKLILDETHDYANIRAYFK